MDLHALFVPPPLFVLPPACSVRAFIVVLTLFIAVATDSLFLDAGPSDTARAFIANVSALEVTLALACVGETVMNIMVFEFPPRDLPKCAA